uniref:Histone H4 transcription factor n=1 Tax=Heterorhabditis bacteriophora TaxID=37862 RepID=A0A1I7WTC3_HETBA
MDKKDELSAHFDVHLNYYVNDPTRREQDPFHCPILSCIHSASTAIELKRHLSMHMVQAHAQFIGRIMLKVKEEFQHLNSCGFDPSLQIFYDGEVAFCLWDQCNYGFTDISELFSHVTLHIDMLDNDDKCSNEYRCLWEQCFKTFLSKGDLRKHVRHHSGEKYCACPFCGRFFCRPDKLYEHLRRKGFAEEDAVFQCHLCQKNFADERTLINHVRRHLSGRQCPMCGLAVPLPSDLHKHIMVKHTERPRNYACRECGKEFYYEFSCMLCDKKFRWKKQLDKHVLTHDVVIFRFIFESVLKSTMFFRFAYKKCADGYMRLQTRKLVRAELLP